MGWNPGIGNFSRHTDIGAQYPNFTYSNWNGWDRKSAHDGHIWKESSALHSRLPIVSSRLARKVPQLHFKRATLHVGCHGLNFAFCAVVELLVAQMTDESGGNASVILSGPYPDLGRTLRLSFSLCIILIYISDMQVPFM